jgi:ABC-2 type transport system permease protein
LKILLIAYQILRRTLTTKKGVLLYILLPSLLIAGIVSLFGNTVKAPFPVAYVNLDQGRLGEDLIRQINTNSLFQAFPMKDSDAVTQAVRKRDTDTGIIIPADFTEKLQSGQAGGVEVYQVHKNERSYGLRYFVEQKINSLQQLSLWALGSSAKDTGGSDAGTIDSEALLDAAIKQQLETPYLSVVENAGKQSLDNTTLAMMCGFTLMFMMGLMNSSVTTIMEDRENFITRRIFAAPVRKFDIFAGNLLGIFIVGSLQLLSILLATRYLFRFDYDIPFFSQFIVLELFLLATMGISCAAAGMVKNVTNLSMIQNLILTPTCMIGGCFWPREIMPDFLQKAGNFVPQSWTIDAILELTTGASLPDIWPNLAVLLLMAAVLLGFGAVVLQPSKAA